MADYFKNDGINTSTNTQRAHRNDINKHENDFNPASSADNSLLQTSTNIFIFAQDSLIGMIQSFTVTENRNINKLQSIGVEGVVQAVPGNTTGGQLNVSRIALYESRIWDALGLTASINTGTKLAFQTLKDQRVPFEIQVKTRKKGSTDDYYYETYIDCWLASYTKSYTVGTITVAEQATISYADVY